MGLAVARPPSAGIFQRLCRDDRRRSVVVAGDDGSRGCRWAHAHGGARHLCARSVDEPGLYAFVFHGFFIHGRPEVAAHAGSDRAPSSAWGADLVDGLGRLFGGCVCSPCSGRVGHGGGHLGLVDAGRAFHRHGPPQSCRRSNACSPGVCSQCDGPRRHDGICGGFGH